MAPEWARNGCQNGGNAGPQMGSKWVPEWGRNGLPNGAEMGSRMGPRIQLFAGKGCSHRANPGPVSETIPVPFWNPFRAHLGTQFPTIPAPIPGPFGHPICPRSGTHFEPIREPVLHPFRDPFRAQLGIQFAPILEPISSPFGNPICTHSGTHSGIPSAPPTILPSSP